MKKSISLLFVLIGVFFIKPVMAQTTTAEFTGAKATQARYRALYYLDEADPKKIGATLRNIGNALNDERLQGKVEIELVAFGDGVAVFQKTGSFEAPLRALQQKGVILAQCNNTIRERHIEKDTLFPFISYVPSGNGEIIIRSAEGWVLVHP